jgi:hypothetical protein
MNRKTTKTLALAALTALLAATAIAPADAAPRRTETSTDDLWFHLTVDGADEGAVSLTLPLPLVSAGLAAFPEATGSANITFNDEEISVAELRRAWNQLRRKPNTKILDVREDGSRVRLWKQGGDLVLSAVDAQDDVEMRIPGPVVDALLSGRGDRLDLGAAFRALADHGAGELTAVTGEGQRVRIWVDRRDEAR